VRIDAPPSNHVTAGCGQFNLPQARQHRSRQYDRCPDGLRQIRRNFVGRERLGVNAQGMIGQAVYVRTQAPQDVAHHAHIGNVRHVPQRNRLFSKQARRNKLERRIFIAIRPHRPLQSMPTFDDKLIHMFDDRVYRASGAKV
jgi:hypothetical protein